MKIASLFVVVILLAGCSGTGMQSMSAEERAQRNLCEWARSAEPRLPGDCSEPPYRCRGCGSLLLAN